jgi:HD-GYP domain-containing protein (c-di-GMP phosphodiesterase class II)
MSLVLDFLEFVERKGPDSLAGLMARILIKCREITDAEAGSIYLVRQRGRQTVMQLVHRQNDGVSVTTTEESASPINRATIVGYVASTGETVREADVRHISTSQNYAFNRKLDPPGYVTRSVLCLPVTNFQDDIVAVVEMVNRRSKGRANPVAFTREQEKILLPVMRVLSGYIERSSNLERIAAQNKKLRQRARTLAKQRAKVADLQAQTEEAFKLSISLLARAAEIHDEGTGNHIVRVNEYSYFLADKIGMPRTFCNEIRHSAQLHDVGKMVVDAAVLKKGGELTDDERQEMNKHPIYGYQILSHSHRLKLAAEIALFHHEKWDGSGYPNQVRGDDIPISARIVAVADAYDALRSARPYKPGFSHEKTVDIIVHSDERIDPQGNFDPPPCRNLFAPSPRHGENLAEICGLISGAQNFATMWFDNRNAGLNNISARTARPRQ